VNKNYQPEKSILLKSSEMSSYYICMYLSTPDLDLLRSSLFWKKEEDSARVESEWILPLLTKGCCASKTSSDPKWQPMTIQYGKKESLQYSTQKEAITLSWWLQSKRKFRDFDIQCINSYRSDKEQLKQKLKHSDNNYDGYNYYNYVY
jgi:hypothetical protein